MRPLMIDIDGVELSAEDIELLQHPKVGGIILFARNYQDKKQLLALTQSIRKIKQDILIAVDHEGGRVQRFRAGFTEIPPASEFGNIYEKNPEQAEIELRYYATIIVNELKAVGIDFSFAPVLDINYGASSVIGDRSFHSDPQIVAKLGAIYVDAVHQAGGFAVGKHFPGHGAAVQDTHVAIAVDLRDFNVLRNNDLVPFKVAVEHGIDGVMAAHVVYSQIDANPATFSSFWLKNILREKFKFKGMIFSDDLNMHAAGVMGDFATRMQLALHAGCDMVLICNNREGVVKAINN